MRDKFMEISEAITTIFRNTLLLLAVINPLGNIPVFSDLTWRLEPGERVRTMNLAVLTAFLIVIIFALIGNWSLRYLFNVTVMELQIAGGILLFIVALGGVMPRNKLHNDTKDTKMLAIFPIACPMLVGPGAITMTIIISQAIGHWMMILTALSTFVVVLLLVRNACRLTQLLGPYVGNVLARLLYIMLAAKAVSMVLAGAEQFYQKLHGG